MMQAYGSVLVAQRMTSQRHAEIAAYVRNEYGRGTGPEFLFAQIANGAGRRPRRRPEDPFAVFRTWAKAMKAFVGGNGGDRKATNADPAR